MKKQYTLLLILIFMVVFMISSFGLNTTYNKDADNFYEKYTLRGPDSYYNLKMVSEQLHGNYETYDYSIAYPYGYPTRPLYFTAITTNFALFLDNMTPLNLEDAVGWTMLLISCFFGAFVIFPLFGITKELFNIKIAFLSVTLYAITPIVYSASHGSFAGLFEHDSFLLFFTLLFVYGYIKIINTTVRERSFIFYLGLCSISLSFIYMTWVAHHFIFVILFLFLIIYLFLLPITKENPFPLLIKTILILDITFLFTLWYSYSFYIILNIVLFTSLATTILFLIYFYLKLNKRSLWAQLGALSSYSMLLLVIIYIQRIYSFKFFTGINRISTTLFSGIYTTKVYETIAEGHLFTLTDFTFSLGILTFLCALFGIILYLYRVKNLKTIDIFFMVFFLSNVYFTTTAGRFTKDIAPYVVIFASLFLYAFVKSIDLKKLKELRFKQLLSFTALFLVITSSFYITFNNVSSDSLFIEDKMVELSSEINSNLSQRPILAFWDYGFFIGTMTNNPVIADNFQNGIYVSCNFFTSQSESEALSVLSVYLIKAEYEIFDTLYYPTIDRLSEHLSEEDKTAFIDAIKTSTKQNDLYQKALPYLKEKPVQEAYTLFNKIQHSTGFFIGYVMIGEREVDDIKIMIPYLADKSEVGINTLEDDWFKMTVNGIENREMFNNSFVMQLYQENETLYFHKVLENNNFKIWEIKDI